MRQTARRLPPRGDVTTISRRGQTVIPARLREQLGLCEGSRLRWMAANGMIVATPVPDDPIEDLAGKYPDDRLLERLLAERRRDRAREAR